jgi:dephospho-CoA kinase
MLEIALTGNRFTGKDFTASKFRSIGVPVFDADTVLKFIINHKFYFQEKLKEELGRSPYVNGDLTTDTIRNDEEFNILVDQVEEELFSAYQNYRKYQTYPYTIFLSSLIYERKWNEKFDVIINTFAPDDERAVRAKLHGVPYVEFYDLKKTEFSQYQKNKIATHVIHSYNSGVQMEKSIMTIDLSIRERLKKLYSYASRG